jgi:hypothetical protein
MAHVLLIPIVSEPAPGQVLELKLELADTTAFKAGVALLREAEGSTHD